MIQSLTGADVIQLDGRILSDLIDGDTVLLEFPNNIGAVKTGKNGNSIFAFNATGMNVNVTIRLVMSSPDDKYIQGRLQEWIADPSAFIPFVGQFVKRVGDGAGNISQNIYNLSGGIPTKIPAAKTNQEGDTEQSVSVYNLSFSNGQRQIT